MEQWTRSMTPERFYAQTERSGECLIWQGRSRNGPYGSVGYRRKTWMAHRLSYYFATGEHPGEGVVRHACDTPLCVEPAHLSLGTHADNVADKVERGRHRRADTHPMRKLDQATVDEIREQNAGGVMQKDLAVQYGVSRQQISKIIRGQRWAAVKGD